MRREGVEKNGLSQRIKSEKEKEKRNLFESPS
jgi:hypothetical protein